jgi:hypothetical protein
VYDQAFQQFHAGGTEMMLSRGVPPVLGNVCVGVWKQVGARTFKLKHMSWNRNPDGSFAGTFEMEVTLRLDRRTSNYSGTWVAENFDVAGTRTPCNRRLHAARSLAQHQSSDLAVPFGLMPALEPWQEYSQVRGLSLENTFPMGTTTCSSRWTASTATSRATRRTTCSPGHSST